MTQVELVHPARLHKETQRETSGCKHMGVSKNNGTPKSSILIGFSIINHPFWGVYHPYFWFNIHIATYQFPGLSSQPELVKHVSLQQNDSNWFWKCLFSRAAWC